MRSRSLSRRLAFSLSLLLSSSSRVVTASPNLLAECAANGCAAGSGGGTGADAMSVIAGTTLVDQVGGQSPAGFPGAIPVSTKYGQDNSPTVQWQVTQPTTLAIPACGPTSPPGATWTVTTKEVTHVVNGQTLIFREPALTAVPPVPVTVTDTEYVHVPPLTLTETETVRQTETQTRTQTQTQTETLTETTTSIPPPLTYTQTETSTWVLTSTATDYITLPPVTSVSTLTQTSTSFVTETSTWIPPPQTFFQTLTSTSFVTETDTSYVTLPQITNTRTVTETTTSVSIPPPQFITSTDYRTVTLPPQTYTQTYTSTSYEYITSTSTYVSVTTQVLPPVTSTATVTSSVSYCPPAPTPACVAGITKEWTATDVYINQPLRIPFSDLNPSILRIQDAGYATETYTVLVDGKSIGTTSAINSNRNNWCPIQVSGRAQCESQGMSKGQFVIPAGDHTVSIVHNNEPGTLGSYSTLFWQTERSCQTAPTTPPTSPACVPLVKQDWIGLDIYPNQPAQISYDDANPSVLRIQDAGYRTETFTVFVDGSSIGTTSPITSDISQWCGITLPARSNCEASGHSKGEFTIPAGRHTVSIQHNMEPGTWGYSTIFWQLDRTCGALPLSPPQCVAQVKQDWTNTDVYVGRPFAINYNDASPSYFRIQDAGYATETYTILVDGTSIGTTSAIVSNRNNWCPIVVSGRAQCESQGMSKGQFVIPPGQHTVQIQHNNDPGTIGTYSTLFWQIQRKC